MPYGGGLCISACSFVKIENNSFTENIGYGFYDLNSEGTLISGNHEEDNGSGSTLNGSDDSLVINNTLQKLTLFVAENCTIHQNSLGSSGLSVSGWFDNYIHNITQNTVGGKPLLYVVSDHGTSYDNSEYGQVYIVNSTEVVFHKNQVRTEVNIIYSNTCTVTEVSCSAISVTFSEKTEIGHCEIIEGFSGVYCREAQETWIHHNTLINTGEGINLDNAPDSSVQSNLIVNATRDGIKIGWLSDMCLIENNTITESAKTTYSEHWGVYTYYAGIRISPNNCTILNNTVTDNEGYGILVYGNSNTIYLKRR